MRKGGIHTAQENLKTEWSDNFVFLCPVQAGLASLNRYWRRKKSRDILSWLCP